LPATSRGGASRIVTRLDKASIPAEQADTIVTEHGVAELRGLSPAQRVQKLIGVAAPGHRAALAAALR
jgi:acetyl-CoA hydrolase